MRRVACATLSLLVLLSVPGATATGTPPALSGTEGPAWTTLTWVAPPGADPSGWTLVRDADDDRFDDFWEFDAATTSHTDYVTPLPGDRFVYTATYDEGGSTSFPSNSVERNGDDPCDLLGQDCCYLVGDLNCAVREACSILPICIHVCPWIDHDLTRGLYLVLCSDAWEACPAVFDPLPPAVRTLLGSVEDTCHHVFP